MTSTSGRPGEDGRDNKEKLLERLHQVEAGHGLVKTSLSQNWQDALTQGIAVTLQETDEGDHPDIFEKLRTIFRAHNIPPENYPFVLEKVAVYLARGGAGEEPDGEPENGFIGKLTRELETLHSENGIPYRAEKKDKALLQLAKECLGKARNWEEFNQMRGALQKYFPPCYLFREYWQFLQSLASFMVQHEDAPDADTIPPEEFELRIPEFLKG